CLSARQSRREFPRSCFRAACDCGRARELSVAAASAGGGGLLGGSRAFGRGPRRRCLAAELATLAARCVALRVAAARARFLPAAALLIHGGPRPALGRLRANPTLLVSLGDVL